MKMRRISFIVALIIMANPFLTVLAVDELETDETISIDGLENLEKEFESEDLDRDNILNINSHGPVTSYEELKKEVDEFNKGDEDRLIEVSGDIIFREDDDMGLEILILL